MHRKKHRKTSQISATDKSLSKNNYTDQSFKKSKFSLVKLLSSSSGKLMNMRNKGNRQGQLDSQSSSLTPNDEIVNKKSARPFSNRLLLIKSIDRIENEDKNKTLLDRFKRHRDQIMTHHHSEKSLESVQQHIQRGEHQKKQIEHQMEPKRRPFSGQFFQLANLYKQLRVKQKALQKTVQNRNVALARKPIVSSSAQSITTLNPQMESVSPKSIERWVSKQTQEPGFGIVEVAREIPVLIYVEHHTQLEPSYQREPLYHEVILEIEQVVEVESIQERDMKEDIELYKNQTICLNLKLEQADKVIQNQHQTMQALQQELAQLQCYEDIELCDNNIAYQHYYPTPPTKQPNISNTQPETNREADPDKSITQSRQSYIDFSYSEESLRVEKLSTPIHSLVSSHSSQQSELYNQSSLLCPRLHSLSQKESNHLPTYSQHTSKGFVEVSAKEESTANIFDSLNFPQTLKSPLRPFLEIEELNKSTERVEKSQGLAESRWIEDQFQTQAYKIQNIRQSNNFKNLPHKQKRYILEPEIVNLEMVRVNQRTPIPRRPYCKKNCSEVCNCLYQMTRILN